MANTHKQPMVRISVDLSPDLHAYLKGRATELDMTMIQFLRKLIIWEMEGCNKSDFPTWTVHITNEQGGFDTYIPAVSGANRYFIKEQP